MIVDDEDFEEHRRQNRMRTGKRGNDPFAASFARPIRRRHKKGLTKQQIEEKTEKARVFLGKRVIAGGRVGDAVQINERGGLVVRHPTSNAVYDPDFVKPA